MPDLPRVSWRTAKLAGLVVLATACEPTTQPTSVVCDPSRPVRNALREAARTADCASPAVVDAAEVRPGVPAR